MTPNSVALKPRNPNLTMRRSHSVADSSSFLR